VDPIDALRSALASRGEALVPATLAAVETTERRLSRELPQALRRVYLELTDGTAGTGGAQALLALDELGPPGGLDPAQEVVPLEGGKRLRARTLIAVTEEDVDGGQWCLLADGRVAYFLPLAGEPGLHLPLPDVAAFLGVLAATGGGEAVVAMGGVESLGLSPR
jgi:hypothetical protein